MKRSLLHSSTACAAGLLALFAVGGAAASADLPQPGLLIATSQQTSLIREEPLLPAAKPAGKEWVGGEWGMRHRERVAEVKSHAEKLDVLFMLPTTKVLLLGTFPKDRTTATPDGSTIQQINATIAKLDDGKRIRFLNINDRLLDKDGSLTKEISWDGVHLTEKGYQIWADAMHPLLSEMNQPLKR